jgi:methylenetetrahydrofolate dehydrogenase (NADP+)/methenyltetrahydrofolate cyclohydrolase
MQEVSFRGGTMMSCTLLDGKALGEKIRKDIKAKVAKLKSKPGLAFILVGENPASKMYVSMKDQACKDVGIVSFHTALKNPSESEIVKAIELYNQDKKVHGILVQLPLPATYNTQKILSAISPRKDVDGLTSEGLGKLMAGNEHLVSCTARGIIRLLEEYNIPMTGKKVVIINHTIVVGRPLAELFLNRGATVTICNEFTKDLAKETIQADILVTAVGKPGLVTDSMVKQGAAVIDAGIARVKDKNKDEGGDTVVGDVDSAAKNKAGFLTPVPGGVGPMTVAILMENTFKAKEAQEKIAQDKLQNNNIQRIKGIQKKEGRS